MAARSCLLLLLLAYNGPSPSDALARHTSFRKPLEISFTEEDQERLTDDSAILKTLREKKTFTPDIFNYRESRGLNDIIEGYGEDVCGIKPVKMKHINRQKRILGGTRSEKGHWPWQVAILDEDMDHRCGGTLIAPGWVLTAAHCYGSGHTIVLGEHHLGYDDDEIKMEVVKYVNYEGFNRGTLEHDISLIKLPEEVKFSEYILPACLPLSKENLPEDNMNCVVSGWGKEKGSSYSGSPVLKHVEVPIVAKSQCKLAYPDYVISPNTFCAGSKKHRIDTCQGDSGGPLVCSDGSKWTVYGVTSYGDGCYSKKNYGVYTEVANYIGWIKATMIKEA